MAAEGSRWKAALRTNRSEIIERLSGPNNIILDRILDLLIQEGCIIGDVCKQLVERCSSSEERCRVLLDNYLQTPKAFDVFCQGLSKTGVCADLAQKLRDQTTGKFPKHTAAVILS